MKEYGAQSADYGREPVFMRHFRLPGQRNCRFNRLNLTCVNAQRRAMLFFVLALIAQAMGPGLWLGNEKSGERYGK